MLFLLLSNIMGVYFCNIYRRYFYLITSFTCEGNYLIVKVILLNFNLILTLSLLSPTMISRIVINVLL
ncbi:putative membrane protein [Candidatus Ichthyocystis hellenicum]|uniref:Putative membrane protein n=1 Tax=Candidatus Ichthyocystis hellenicum TaxID=1561003 RepID=A0A0S4M490_9BURK|nr:putative membrane protein [Candidatus Ichthyocystis hellenicum]